MLFFFFGIVFFFFLSKMYNLSKNSPLINIHLNHHNFLPPILYISPAISSGDLKGIEKRDLFYIELA